LKNEINANVYKAEILYNLSSLITSNSLDNIEKQFREIIKKGSLKKEACIIIRNKIENISTYDQADQYFDNILIPNLSEFSLEDLWDIKHKSMENSQINKRRDFEKTMSFIEQRITFLSR
ncbi:MAG: hypothetical protein KKE30_22660, partial [Gammaproteobacteria bacterium]|nr:hypothetical protein [Gammaproteobacteria bacterium]